MVRVGDKIVVSSRCPVGRGRTGLVVRLGVERDGRPTARALMDDTGSTATWYHTSLTVTQPALTRVMASLGEDAQTSYGYGYGYGYGNGYGNGHGYGYGYGNGYGNGYGYGDGDGYGNGYGYSYGDGNGNGSGYGYS